MLEQCTSYRRVYYKIIQYKRLMLRTYEYLFVVVFLKYYLVSRVWYNLNNNFVVFYGLLHIVQLFKDKLKTEKNNRLKSFKTKVP